MLSVADEKLGERRPGSFIDEQRDNSGKQTKRSMARRPLQHAHRPSTLVLCALVLFPLTFSRRSKPRPIGIANFDTQRSHLR
jgi:hypothetical protein